MQEDSLYTLIKSLTKTEKGYFKKFSSRHNKSGDNAYLKLFDEIEKQCGKGEYNEEKLKYRFKGEKTLNNFPVAKNYLYRSILKSLNSYYSQFNAENIIKEQVKSVEILYRKALYKECISLLTKAKSEAYKYDYFIQLLDIFKWEKSLALCGAYGKIYESLVKIYKEEEHVLELLNNWNEFRMLSHKVHDLVARVEENYSERDALIGSILNEEILSDENKALSYSAKINFYYIKAKLYYILKDYSSSNEFSKKSMELMENSPDRMKEGYVNYIIILLNVMDTSLKIKNYADYEMFTQRMKAIREGVTGGISEEIKVLLFIGEISMYIEMGDINTGYKALPDIITGLDRYKGKINKLDEYTFYYYIAYLYFAAGDHSPAVEWLNKILNEKDDYAEVYVYSMMLSILSHYEMGNFLLSESMVSSLERYLKKNTAGFSAEAAVIRHLKKILNTPPSETKSIFSELWQALKHEQEAKGEPVFSFDYGAWAEAKLTGIEFGNILRSKFHKNIKTDGKNL